MRYAVCLTGLFLGGLATPLQAADPVALRAESFLVLPSSQPLAWVDVQNLRAEPYRGTVALKGPEGWHITPAQHEVALKPGEAARVQFEVRRGVSHESNRYPLEITATGAGATVVRRQDVFCASAPYFKPTIDGDPSEWKDAIPVTFVKSGKKTVVSTYWNKQHFCLLVAVEEDKLTACQDPPGQAGFDAVQVAIAAQGGKTGTAAHDPAGRFEFLFVATGSGTAGKCFQLASPGMKLTETQQERALAGLLVENVAVAVSRRGGVTFYECAVPVALIREEVRPSEGREFCFSVLVHDPDGTGLRDLGEAAGLWPSQRNRLAWSRWPGAVWPAQPPMDSRLEWGCCSSKY